jgi:hypothetical protein
MRSVDTPKLDTVKGAFNLQSSENMTCSYFDEMHSKKTIKGKYKCAGRQEDPAGEGSNSGTKDGNNKPSAASSLSAVNGALGLAAMAAVLLF